MILRSHERVHTGKCVTGLPSAIAEQPTTPPPPPKGDWKELHLLLFIATKLTDSNKAKVRTCSTLERTRAMTELVMKEGYSSFTDVTPHCLSRALFSVGGESRTIQDHKRSTPVALNGSVNSKRTAKPHWSQLLHVAAESKRTGATLFSIQGSNPQRAGANIKRLPKANLDGHARGDS